MTLEMPVWFGTPNERCRRGRRMSVSTISTRPPASAIVTPRLIAVVVLPSCGLGLVTTIVRGGLSGDMNRMLVRIERQHSAATDFGSRNTPRSRSRTLSLACAASPPGAAPMIGTRPSTGTPRNCSTSACVFSVLSSASMANASATPVPRPSSRPSSRFCTGLGRTGEPGTIARSRMRTLFVFIGPVMSISFWRLAIRPYIFVF